MLHLHQKFSFTVYVQVNTVLRNHRHGIATTDNADRTALNDCTCTLYNAKRIKGTVVQTRHVVSITRQSYRHQTPPPGLQFAATIYDDKAKQGGALWQIRSHGADVDTANTTRQRDHCGKT